MQIRRLWINNFRGVRRLDWKIPLSQQLTVLVGPGDTGKSTILEAIHLLLGDRWMVGFTDTDFYGADVEKPIVIEGLIVDIPDPLKKDTALGLSLSGVDDEGELHQDPEDGLEPALLVRLSVDASLEPKWCVARSSGDQQPLSTAQRRFFSTFKVDDRTDAQLRWSRTSPLGRLSAQDGSEREALAAAARAARDALAGHENSALSALAEKVQQRANKLGGGSFVNMRPGLDTSRSATGAALALYEDAIPLTSYGLGSRRLASLAVQQLAAGERSVAVIDELESGLEPHRAVRLLTYLMANDEYSQVIITTHSPVLVEHAELSNLATVQNEEGVATVTSLRASSDLMQRLRRNSPSSLLARRVVVVEGKTEHGIILECIDTWDAERGKQGLSTAAGEGVAVVDAGNGSEAVRKAEALLGLGLAAAALLDNDDRTVDAAVRSAQGAGVRVIRWMNGENTETQLCSSLSCSALTALIELGSDLRHGTDTVLQDLSSVDPERPVSSLDVKDWLDAGITIEEARNRVAQAASGRKWFKTVDGGRDFARFVLARYEDSEVSGLTTGLDQVREFIYPGPAVPETPATRESAVDG
jgi:putative ATP-dependent endonuclease of OLD family